MSRPDDFEETSLGKVYDSQLMARLWPYVRPYKGWIGLSFLLIPLRALLEVTPPLIVGAALNLLTEGFASSEVPWIQPFLEARWGITPLVWLFLLAVGVAIVSLSVEWIRAFAMIALGQNTVRDVRRDLFDHVQKLPMRFFDRYPVGRLVTRLTNDLENLAEMFSAGVVALVADLFVMGFFLYILFTVNPTLALVAIAVVPFLTVAAVIFRYKVRTAFREVRVKVARLNSHLQETISGMKVVQLFARERRNLADFERQNASHRDSWFRSIHYDALLFSSVDLATNLTRALIFWFGARMLGAGEISIGTVYVFTDYMTRFFRPLMDLSAKYSVMQSSMASAERIFQLLDREREVEDTVSEVASGAGEVVFEHVTFAYGEDGGGPVLDDVSFRVAPGERVAIVGHTGSGKTTTLKLLARLYELQKGSIRIDGVDVRDIPRSELRRRLAFVLQDVFLFDGDLRYNLSLGSPDISAEQLEQAARVTHVDALVNRLDEGWDQPVSERGVNFSTGERQLLSFARALVRDPQILLLDEATSSVDTETEALIQDALQELMKGKTSIVVAHRLSTIQDVDRIYVFHHGRICEQGNHEELLAQKGLYWRLYHLQYAQQAGSSAA